MKSSRLVATTSRMTCLKCGTTPRTKEKFEFCAASNLIRREGLSKSSPESIQWYCTFISSTLRMPLGDGGTIPFSELPSCTQAKALSSSETRTSSPYTLMLPYGWRTLFEEMVLSSDSPGVPAPLGFGVPDTVEFCPKSPGHTCVRKRRTAGREPVVMMRFDSTELKQVRHGQ